MSAEDEFVTVADLVRLGEQVREHTGRPVAEAEMDTLFDELHQLRMHRAILDLWESGRVVVGLSDTGEVVYRATETVR